MLEIDTKYNPVEKLWEGPLIKPLFNPKVPIGQVIINMLSMHGTKIAQISDDFEKESTFDEILIKTIRSAQNLQKLNCEPKSVVGIIANNGPDLAPIIFASMCCGYPVSSIDPMFGKSELKSLIVITKPKIFFCDVNSYDILESCLNDLNIVAQIYTFNGVRRNSTAVDVLFATTNNESNFVLTDVDGENETAVIVGSHGITGSLEGVCLSHAQLLDRCTRLNSVISGDILFAFSSVYWLSGIGNLLKATYFGATRIITSNPFNAELLLQLVEKYKITHLFISLQQIISVLSLESIETADLSSVKSIALSGQNLTASQYFNIKKYFTNALPYNMFGICELGGAISILYGSQSYLNSSGSLVNGIQVKIIDENGNRLGIDGRGRIFVKSPYLFIGYYNKIDTESIADDEGFMRTRYVGYFNADGYLHVMGREVDMIKYQNFQISPKEIENVLIQHSAIKSICVVGVSNKQDENLVAAVVIPKKGCKITEDEVHSLISENFDESYQLRGGVYFVDELPLTVSGKIIQRIARMHAEKEFNSRNKGST